MTNPGDDDHQASEQDSEQGDPAAPPQTAPLQSSPDSAPVDDGPGCMPAVLAGSALAGIMFFVCCGFSTWFLYQQRTLLATRTLRHSYLPDLEQSLLDPKSKEAVMKEIESLADDMERGKLENWQSAGVMQRLQRLPVLQWGDLRAVESFIIENGNDDQIEQTRLQFTRVRLGVKQGTITSFDFFDLLSPVQTDAASAPHGKQLIQPLTVDAIMDTVQRARLLADREQISATPEIPTSPDERVTIGSIVKEEIQQGIAAGGF